MMRLFCKIIGLLIICSVSVLSQAPTFQLELELRYEEGVPLKGPYNLKVYVMDDNDKSRLDKEFPVSITDGVLSVEFSDASIDWVTYLEENHAPYFRLHLKGEDENDDERIRVPLDYRAYAITAKSTRRAKQFNNDAVIRLDYDKQYVSLFSQPLTHNAVLGMSQPLHARSFVGDASAISNLTGVGLNDGHSLNSPDGTYKDVVFSDAQRHLGVHTMSPKSQLHVNGDVMFRSRPAPIAPVSVIDSGSVFLWEPSKGSFISGHNKFPLQPYSVGKYVVGFGSDVQPMLNYSTILGGQRNTIGDVEYLRSPYEASVIVGGENNTIRDGFSVVLGGISHNLKGLYSVVMGGESHDVMGQYTVVMGGLNHRITSSNYSMVFGESHHVDSNLSFLMGQSHIASLEADSSVLLGEHVVAQHPNTIIYSDGSYVESKYPGQIVVYASKGVGVQRVPEYGVTKAFALDVNATLNADLFIGDGSQLTNISLGQDLWERPLSNGGVYIDIDHLLIGRDSSNLKPENEARFVVDGGMRIGTSNTVVPGTLSYTDNLYFYTNANGRVTVNVRDLNTTLSSKRGVSIVDDVVHLKIPLTGITDSHYLRIQKGANNIVRWEGVESNVWNNGSSSAIYVNPGDTKKAYLNLMDVSSNVLPFPLVVQSVTNNINLGTKTAYPVVIGAIVCTSFDPKEWSIYFNQECYSDTSSVGRFMAHDSIAFGYKDTHNGHNNVFTISTSSVVVGGGSSSLYSLDLPSTQSITSIVFNHTHLEGGTDTIGIGSLSEGQYLSLNSDDLVFKSNGQIALYVNSTGGSDHLVAKMTDAAKFVVGTGDAREKLTIHNGLLGLNVDGGRIKSDSGADIRSGYNNNVPSLRLFNKDSGLMMDMSENKIAVGTSNQGLSVGETLFYSNINPTVWLESNAAQSSKLVLETKDNTADLNYKGSVFSINYGNSQQALTPYMVFGETDMANSMIHLGSGAVTFNKSMGVEEVRFSDSGVGITGNSNLVFYTDVYPMQFSINGVTGMVVSNNGHIGIGSNQVDNVYRIFVPTDAKFESTVGYGSDSTKTLQSFHVSSSDQSFSNVDSLVIDTDSGLGLDHTSLPNTITLTGPSAFVTFNAMNNTSFKSGSNGTLEFVGGLGVSINLIEENLVKVVKLFNPLFANGGEIFGGLSINGMLKADKILADGSLLKKDDIPWKWQEDNNGAGLTFNGRVGIGTESPSTSLEVFGGMNMLNLTVQNGLMAEQVNFYSGSSLQEWAFTDPVKLTYDNAGLFKLRQSSNHFLTLGSDQLSLFSSNLSSPFFLDNQDLDKDMLVYTNNESRIAAMQLDYSVSTSKMGVTKSSAFIDSNKKVRLLASSNWSVILDPDTVVLQYNANKKGVFVGSNTKLLNKDVLMVQNKLRVGGGTGHTNATAYAQDGLTIGLNDRANSGVYIKDYIVLGSDSRDSGTNYTFQASNANMQSLDIVLTNGTKVGRVSGNIIESLGQNKLVIESDTQVSINSRLKINSDGVRFGQGNPVSNVDLMVGSGLVTGSILLEGARPNLELQSGNNTSNIKLTDDIVQFNVQGSKPSDGLHVSESGVGINKVAESTNALSVTPAIKVNALYKNGQRLYPMPIGAIVMWTDSTIPDGWALCDGTSYTDKYGGSKSTPDLRDRFIMGATDNIGVKGGVNQTVGFDGTGVHTHPLGGGHDHDISNNGTERHAHTYNFQEQGLSDSVDSLGNSAYSDVYSRNKNQWPYQGNGEATVYSHKKFSTTSFVISNEDEVKHDHELNEHSHLVNSNEDQWSNHHKNNGNNKTGGMDNGKHNHPPNSGGHDHTVDNNQPEYYTLMFIIKIY
jgi:hypothetical protein